uniref:Uncharacterized protein n=1 Tax=Amphimedon queenslandica TaxID=400682 RepID=A0A1X7VCY8_AMPQE
MASTFFLVLAEVSKKGQPQDVANEFPSIGVTALSASKSHLLPTSSIGTFWTPFTRRI